MASYISRANVSPLMPEEFQREIVQSVAEQSIIMQVSKRLSNMARGQRRIPVLSALPTAYFSNPGSSAEDNDIPFKNTTKMQWANKYIDAEELNVIIAIPESALDDQDYDLWGEIKPKLLEAFGLAFDKAVLYGIQAPSSWATNIYTASQAAGNFVELSTGASASLYDDILSEGGVIQKVELDGYMASGHIADMSMRAKLRGVKDSTGQPIFKTVYKDGMQGGTNYELDGEMMYFPRNGCMIPESALMFSGDWSQLVYAIRQDISWKILDQAVIQDPSTGAIVYNLAQQDMVALRGTMRLGWQVPNPINRVQSDSTKRYPFAVLGVSGS